MSNIIFIMWAILMPFTWLVFVIVLVLAMRRKRNEDIEMKRSHEILSSLISGFFSGLCLLQIARYPAQWEYVFWDLSVYGGPLYVLEFLLTVPMVLGLNDTIGATLFCLGYVLLNILIGYGLYLICAVFRSRSERLLVSILVLSVVVLKVLGEGTVVLRPYL